MTRSALLVLLPLLVLPGCDNFREAVTTESWKPALSTAAPAAPHLPGFETEIGTTVRTEGAGKEVMTGDLVHLRYTRSTTWADKTEHADHAEQVWIWTGREPDPETGLWGTFGTSELRTTLIGRKVGETFELRVTGKHNAVTAPLYGIAAPSLRKGNIEYIGHYLGADSRVLAGAPSSSDASWSTITILAACPAKFATRRGRMTQWGYVINVSGTGWETDRSGELRWSAIEAKCPAPDGDVRFMMGPIYWTGKPWVPGKLMAWQTTYFEKHPKGIFPEDYAFVTINGRTLPTKP